MLFPDLAYAAAGPPGGGSQSMLPTIVMVASMKRGDRVVTTSGMHGTVTGLNEHTVVLRVADQVKLEFDRSAIGRVVAGQGEKDA